MKRWFAVLCGLLLVMATSADTKGCDEPLGLKNGHIKNEQITASSSKEEHFARLLNTRAWCSATHDVSPYLQISLGKMYSISGISTQGSPADRTWVTEYEIQYNSTTSGWISYRNQSFAGNTNARQEKRHTFDETIVTNAIRIYPKDFISFRRDQSAPCLRLELYGCPVPSSCLDPGSPENGVRQGSSFAHGQEVKFVCNSGFDLEGSSAAVCNEGKWNSSLPSCKASCMDPGSPKNGSRQGSKFGHGQQVTFVCNSGFNLEGSSAVVCNEGKWNSSLPSCKASCLDPGSPEDGFRLGSNFGHGQEVKFVCNSGFDLEGSSAVVCSDGKWNSSLPSCKASCLDPGSPKDGSRQGSNFGHGQEVKFFCNSGFDLEGSSAVVCSDGKWNSSLPLCKASCLDPGSPEDGFRVGSNFGHGQEVKFVCNSGFDLEGSSAVVCNEGKWNSSLPSCKASCLDPGSPKNGSRQGSNFRHGQEVKFFCNSGFDLEGSSAVVCNEGKWNSSLPSCKESPALAAECTNYATLDDSTRAQGYRSGPFLNCDAEDLEAGWYRFSGESGTQMAETCVPINRCGTHAPGWLNGTHPSVGEIVDRTVCYHWEGNCCRWSNKVKVRNCGSFFVYELQKGLGCYMRYCGNGNGL